MDLMDLTALTTRLRAAASRRPAVLLVPTPAGTSVRLAVERFCRTRGWPLAESPAGADAMVVAGPVGASLAGAVEHTARQLPAPAVRLSLVDTAEVSDRLATLPRRLATARPGRAGHDWPDLPMAGTAPDRDGLELDALTVFLGPVLPHWPAGLRLGLRVQGDVVQHAEVDVLGTEPVTGSYWRGSARRHAAGRLDALARLLAVAGWPAAHLAAQDLRDRLLAGEPGAALASRFARLRRRVEHSRLLAAALPERGDVPDRLRGWLRDVDALLPDLDAAPPSAESATPPRTDGPSGQPARPGGAAELGKPGGPDRPGERDHPNGSEGADEPRTSAGPEGAAELAGPTDRASPDRPRRELAELPDLVTGTDLTTTRLIVAGLAPDLAALPTREGAGRGP
ncbi:hypothetical protein SAMN05421810_114105 [Amycolatopsis arida]|uniref:Uncharacterized protein n=1 Tax=Amycolatopsis arida TaxID=587909 RepID=A0A1I6ATW9_9PSEU|nr:hypothetical protein [Amycolatopsis arida]TDX97518.1 hypothetical protein CLV69_102622 [Amycolatopsis arida]SFQ72144.1 hypothetical protein SAMN05421810_114105 [Amycolatopsis arida]